MSEKLTMFRKGLLVEAKINQFRAGDVPATATEVEKLLTEIAAIEDGNGASKETVSMVTTASKAHVKAADGATAGGRKRATPLDETKEKALLRKLQFSRRHFRLARSQFLRGRRPFYGTHEMTLIRPPSGV